MHGQSILTQSMNHDCTYTVQLQKGLISLHHWLIYMLKRMCVYNLLYSNHLLCACIAIDCMVPCLFHAVSIEDPTEFEGGQPI